MMSCLQISRITLLCLLGIVFFFDSCESKIFCASEGKIQFDVTLDEASDTATIRATGKTKGYIGFGISLDGKMDKADIIIAGVNDNSGQGYAVDYIGEGHQPVKDLLQNVKLISFNQTSDTTFVEFTRPIQTSDPQDLPIKGPGVTKVIWSLGDTDALIHHGLEGVIDVDFFAGGDNTRDCQAAAGGSRLGSYFEGTIIVAIASLLLATCS